jgi:hypothetical protein
MVHPFGCKWRSRIPAVMLVCVSASAAADDVTVEVQPSSISVLPSYSQVQAIVALKNASSSDTVRSVTLTWLTNDGFSIAAGPPSSKMARPGQSILWPLIIKNVNHSHLPGTIVFDAAYLTTGASPRHIFKPLSLSSEADGSPKPVEASLDGNFDAIAQNRPGYGSLLVTNNSNLPMHIDANPIVPTQIFEQPPSQALDVAARSSIHIPVLIEANSQLTPGVYSVFYEINAQWNAGGHVEQRRLIVSKPATAGVFFESELLKALGVPSFLVLPGCLALFTMQLLLTLGVLGLKDQSKAPASIAWLTSLKVTDPGFWIVSITFSGFFALVYTRFGNNYIIRYGVTDLENVWMWSIGIGLVAYFAIALWTLRHRRLYVPSRTDPPLTILEKMSRNGASAQPSKVGFQLSGVLRRMFVIEQIEDEQTLVWVAPPIVVTWAESALARTEQQTFDQNLNDAVGPQALVQQIREAMKNGYVTSVNWNLAEAVPNPYHLKIESITQWLPPERMVSSA